jgi:hypothetical protein
LSLLTFYALNYKNVAQTRIKHPREHRDVRVHFFFAFFFFSRVEQNVAASVVFVFVFGGCCAQRRHFNCVANLFVPGDDGRTTSPSTTTATTTTTTTRHSKSKSKSNERRPIREI